MKKYLLSLVFISIISNCLFGQYFSKIIEGDIATEPSDSRSCNWIDYNNDEWLDVQVTNGKQTGDNNLLYKNNGDNTFTKITGDAIVADDAPSDGATWADYDNDGDLDCFVVNWYDENNLFYENNGDGTFDQITSGDFVNDGGYSETASWGDYNNDGFVDLYVTNSAGSKKNFLYKNNGDKTFTTITTGAVVNDAHSSRSINWIDFDDDRDADIFVTNESNQDEDLYLNNNDETFTSITDNDLVNSGDSTMSSSWGDIDNDGDFDVFLANDLADNALFRNDGDGVFTKLTDDIISNEGGHSFGSNFGDIDNDGDIDLFVTNSFGAGLLNNFLYINNGDGTFTKNNTDITTTDTGWSYGNAFGDYDKDGDLDLIVANCYNGAETTSLFNNNATGNNWLIINCIGIISNKSAIGARVKIKANINGIDVWQVREITAQSGYCGQNMLPAHFGLGNATDVDSLIILWPSGINDTITELYTNLYYDMVESGDVSIKNLEINKLSLNISPNPSYDEITISFNLIRSENVTIELMDETGKLIKTICERTFNPGENQINFKPDYSKIPSGNYLVTLKTVSGIETEKIILIR